MKETEMEPNPWSPFEDPDTLTPGDTISVSHFTDGETEP